MLLFFIAILYYRIIYIGITLRGSEVKMIFYLIRHGQTDWNKEKRLQGQKDIPMNDEGIKQMEELSEKMAALDLKADRIICSPLNRAQVSAGIIADRIRFKDEIIYDPDFIERDFGLLEGVVWSPELNLNDPKYNAESVQDICDRAKRALEKYDFSESEKVIIVAHGAILSAVKSVLSGGLLDYDDRTVPIIQGNVLCCEIGINGKASFAQLLHTGE